LHHAALLVIDHLYGVEKRLQRSVDLILYCRVHGIQSAHLRVQVFAQSNLFDKVLPHLQAAFMRSCTVGVTYSLCNEPALDLSDTGLADSEEVLRLLSIGVRTVSLGKISRYPDPRQCHAHLCMFIIFGCLTAHNQLHVFATGCMEHLLFEFSDLHLKSLDKSGMAHRKSSPLLAP